jgi:hypothetical protein
MEITQVQEKVFYQDTNVTVTQSRFIANGKTYAMSNISSVAIFKKVKSRLFQILLIIVGLAVCFTSNDAKILGFVIAAIGCLALYFTKDEYSVRITSNAGEADGFISKDQQYIQKIVTAVNDAIIHRG